MAEDIVRDLGLKMKKLEKPLVINGADSNTLNITGTLIIFMSSQETREKRRMIEAAVLSGGKDRELLVSLKNLKRFRMIHSTFPRETIDQYFIRYNRNTVNKEYSNAYKVSSSEFEELPQYYKPSREHLKKPSKEAQDLKTNLLKNIKTISQTN